MVFFLIISRLKTIKKCHINNNIFYKILGIHDLNVTTSFSIENNFFSYGNQGIFKGNIFHVSSSCFYEINKLSKRDDARSLTG